MFSILMISPIQDSPSASQTLIDSTLLLPVAGPHNLPHFLEPGRCVNQENWFNHVKWFAQGQTRHQSQERSVFQRSAPPSWVLAGGKWVQLLHSHGSGGHALPVAASEEVWWICAVQYMKLGIGASPMGAHWWWNQLNWLFISCSHWNWKQLGLIFGFPFPPFFFPPNHLKFKLFVWGLN